MKKKLETALRAIADNDIIPSLQHFYLNHGELQASNGRITYRTHIDGLDDITALVPARDFVRACAIAEYAPEVRQEGDVVIVKKGRFRCKLQTLPLDDFPTFEGIEGETFETENFLQNLRVVAPFVAKDSPHPWANGALIDQTGMYATNNVILVHMPFVSAVRFVLPAATIQFLTKTDEEPVSVTKAQNFAVFEFADGDMLKTSLVAEDWPDRAPSLLVDSAPPESAIASDELLDAVRSVADFANPKLPVVRMDDGVLRVENNRKEASVATDLPTGEAAYRADLLMKVLEVSDFIHIDGFYPNAAPFFAENGLRGVLAGVRV